MCINLFLLNNYTSNTHFLFVFSHIFAFFSYPSMPYFQPRFWHIFSLICFSYSDSITCIFGDWFVALFGLELLPILRLICPQFSPGPWPIMALNGLHYSPCCSDCGARGDKWRPRYGHTKPNALTYFRHLCPRKFTYIYFYTKPSWFQYFKHLCPQKVTYIYT